jgi:hypothetical protein
VRLIVTTVFVVLSAFVAGCGGDAWVEVGTGRAEHVDLVDGDEVEIVEGPQGGYMIAMSLVAGGVMAGDPADPTDPDNPRVTFQAFADDDVDRAAPLGSITIIRGLDRADDGALLLAGTWLIFNAALETTEYFDQAIVVDVRIVDAHGSEAADSAAVTSVWNGELEGR